MPGTDRRERRSARLHREPQRDRQSRRLSQVGSVHVALRVLATGRDHGRRYPLDTRAIALYGAVVATASLVVAVLSFWSGAPILRPRTSLRPAAGGEPAILLIAIRNIGRAPGQVRRIELDLPGPYSIGLGSALPLRGPDLPAIVDAHSTATWGVAADQILEYANRHGLPHHVRAVVTAGSGKRVWESIHRYTNLLSG